MLLHFRCHVDGLGNAVTIAGDANGVVNSGQVPRFKLHVEYRSDHLYDMSDGSVFLCHAVS